MGAGTRETPKVIQQKININPRASNRGQAYGHQFDRGDHVALIDHEGIYGNRVNLVQAAKAAVTYPPLGNLPQPESKDALSGVSIYID